MPTPIHLGERCPTGRRPGLVNRGSNDPIPAAYHHVGPAPYPAEDPERLEGFTLDEPHLGISLTVTVAVDRIIGSGFAVDAGITLRSRLTLDRTNNQPIAEPDTVTTAGRWPGHEGELVATFCGLCGDPPEKGTQVDCWLIDAGLVGAESQCCVFRSGRVGDLDQPVFAVGLGLGKPGSGGCR